MPRAKKVATGRCGVCWRSPMAVTISSVWPRCHWPRRRSPTPRKKTRSSKHSVQNRICLAIRRPISAPRKSSARPRNLTIDPSLTRKVPMPLRFCLCLAFAVATVAAAMPIAVASDFTPEQRQQIEAIIGDYLKTHPEILIDAIQAADDKMKADEKDKAKQVLANHRQAVFDDPQSPVAGNPKGAVTLVEFFDYRCPYCKQVEPALEKLIGDDHQLRFVYKEFPVLGPDSETAARVALA